MSIKAYVDELEQIQAEIKRNNARNSILRQRSKELEANIADYLAHKGQHGIKYNGRAVVIEQKEKRPVKKKKEKEADIISFLEKLGIDDAADVYNQLLDVQRCDPVEESKIKFKKIPVPKN